MHSRNGINWSHYSISLTVNIIQSDIMAIRIIRIYDQLYYHFAAYIYIYIYIYIYMQYINKLGFNLKLLLKCIHVCMYVCKSMQFMYTCVVKAAFVFLHSVHC